MSIKYKNYSFSFLPDTYEVKNSFSGSVNADNLNKRILLFDRGTCELLSTTTPESDGTFTLTCPYREDEQLIAICTDEEGIYNADVFDRVSLCSVEYPYGDSTSEIKSNYIRPVEDITEISKLKISLLMTPYENNDEKFLFNASEMYVNKNEVKFKDGNGNPINLDIPQKVKSDGGAFYSEYGFYRPSGLSTLLGNENDLFGDGSCIAFYAMTMGANDLTGNNNDISFSEYADAGIESSARYASEDGFFFDSALLDMVNGWTVTCNLKTLINYINWHIYLSDGTHKLAIGYDTTDTNELRLYVNGTYRAQIQNIYQTSQKHFSVSYSGSANGSVTKIYNNGLLIYTYTMTINAITSARVAHQAYLGHLRIFNRVLSGTEILETMSDAHNKPNYTNGLYGQKLQQNSITDEQIKPIIIQSNLTDKKIFHMPLRHGIEVSPGSGYTSGPMYVEGTGFKMYDSYVNISNEFFRGISADDASTDISHGLEDSLEFYTKINLSSKDDCVIWKSGDEVNGIAIGISSNSLGVFATNNSVASSFTIDITALDIVDVIIHIVFSNLNKIQIYSDKWALLGESTGTLSVGLATIQEAIGAASGGSPITGITTELLSADLYDINTYNNGEFAPYPTSHRKLIAFNKDLTEELEIVVNKSLFSLDSEDFPIFVKVPTVSSLENTEFVILYDNSHEDVDTVIEDDTPELPGDATQNRIDIRNSGISDSLIEYSDLDIATAAYVLNYTIIAGTFAGDLTDFPVVIQLGGTMNGVDTSVVFDELSGVDDWKKLTITDADNKLYTEIENWNNGIEALAEQPTITDQSSYYSTNTASKMFDGLLSVGEYWLTDTGQTFPHWASWGYADVLASPVFAYSLQPNSIPENSRMVNDWTFEGSNDNLTWDILDTVTNQTGWIHPETRTYECDVATTSYRYYRIVVTANNGDAYTQIGELVLYLTATATLHVKVPTVSASVDTVLTISYDSTNDDNSVGADTDTKLLLHADDTDGSTTFIDSSASSHVITATGVEHDDAEKKFGDTSAFFNTATSVMTIPDSDDFNPGTEDWTVDFWFRREMSTSQGLWSTHTDTLNGLSISIFSSTSFRVYSPDLKLSVTPPALNTWAHVALVQSSGTTTLYLDGIDKGSFDSSGGLAYGGSGCAIGRLWTDLTTNAFYGHMDEIRVSNTARWTANFTPPTGPYSILTESKGHIGETASIPAQQVWDSNFAAVYHMAQDPTGGAGCILDSTANLNHGTPQGAMASTSSLVTGITGNALSFNGTSDVIDFGNSTTLNGIKTSEFSFRNIVGTSSEWGGTIQKYVSSTDRWGFYNRPNASGTSPYFAGAAYEESLSPTADWDGNATWQSFAHTNSGSELELFVNGISDVKSTSTLSSPDEANGGNFYVAGYLYTSEAFTYSSGEFDEVRLSTIVRSADWIDATNKSLTSQLFTVTTPVPVTGKAFNYTIPAGTVSEDITDFPLTVNLGSSVGANDFDTSVVFEELATGDADADILIHSDTLDGNTDFESTALYGTISTHGSLTHSEDRFKFGTSSIKMDALGEYIDGEIRTIGDNDFTIDFWINFTSVTSQCNFLGDFGGTLYTQANNLYFYVSGNHIFTNIAINEWHHIALVRSSGTTKLYKNGTSVGSYTDSNTYGDAFYIGGKNHIPYMYLDEFRISSNVARWTEDFTPPTSVYTDPALGWDKLIITDAADNKVYTEVEEWDSVNKKATLHVKVPTVSAASDTVLTVNYDSTNADNSVRLIADASDDFTGNDGDSTDPLKWVEGVTPIGTAPSVISGNRLVTTHTTASQIRRRSAFALGGNFDIQVDYEILLDSDTVTSLCQFCVSATPDLSDNWGYVDWRQVDIERYLCQTKINGTATNEYYNNNLTHVGKFRITRVADVLTVYIWNAGWEQARQTSGFPTDPMFVLLTSRITVDGNFTTAFDNFVINSVDSITGFIGETGSTPAQQVWDNNFVFVSHQAQDPSGTAPQILDSTSYTKHGTSTGSMTSGDLVDGLVGKALNYDGVDDSTDHGYDSAHDITDTLTIEAVFNPNVLLDSGLTVIPGIISRQQNPTGGDTYGLFINTSGRLYCGTTGGNIQSTKDSWAADTDFYVASTYNSTGLVGDLFVDGVAEVLTTDSYDTMAGSTNNLEIGTDGDNNLNAVIDEVRISNIVRSADWIKLTNLSLTDQLITINLIADALPPGWENAFSTKATILSSFVDDDLTDEYIAVSLSEIAGTNNSENLKPMFNDILASTEVNDGTIESYKFGIDRGSIEGFNAKNVLFDSTIDGGLLLDGAAEKLLKLSGFDFNQTNYTLSFWAYLDGSSSDAKSRDIITSDAATKQNIVYYNSTNMYFKSNNMLEYHNLPVYESFVNYTIVFNHSSNRFDYYRNGEYISYDSTSTEIYVANTSIILGGGTISTDNMIGKLRDVAVYGDILTASEIKLLYDNGPSDIAIDSFITSELKLDSNDFNLLDDVNVTKLSFNISSGSSFISVTFDNKTFMIASNSTTLLPIVSSDPIVHGNVSDNALHYKDSLGNWIKFIGTYGTGDDDINRAISTAMSNVDASLRQSGIFDLTEFTDYSSSDGILNIYCTTLTQAGESVSAIQDIKINDIVYQFSDIYNLDNVGTVDTSNIKWYLIRDGNRVDSLAATVEVSLDGDTSWTACTHDQEIPVLTNGLNVSGRSMRFRVTWNDQDINGTSEKYYINLELYVNN